MKPFYLLRIALLMLLFSGWNRSSIAQTTTFVYSGAVMQTYSVNAGIFSVTVDVQGAKGGNDNLGYGTGGNGGRVQCAIATTPGTVLNVFVGGVGSNGISSSSGGTGGFNGGGRCTYYYGGSGGGASDIRVGGSALTNRVVVGGGGAGSGYGCSNGNGGAGGFPTGGNGNYCSTYNSTYDGAGGSQTAGGATGSGGSTNNTPGSLGLGGNSQYYGGGGGGGYYGGGGSYYYGGAGGGSNYASSTLASSITHTSGYNASNGTITITGICTPPTGGAITGTTTVCGAGVISSLTATGSIGGQWYSSNPAVATVTNTGVVTSVGVGSTTISYDLVYACGNASATTVFTVNQIPTPIFPLGATTVCAGATVTYSDVTTGGTWSSDNTYLATINPTSGQVTGVSGGVGTIRYTVTATGCYTTTTVNINSAPAAISGTPSVCYGSTTTLTEITAGGTWSSTSPVIATVSSTGIVTGANVNGGTTNIVYTLTSTGCTTTLPVTVFALPANNSVIGGGSYCPGAPGVSLRLTNNSTLGVNYQLYNGSIPVGGPVAGNGGILSFGNQTAVGTYSVTAINAISGCSKGYTAGSLNSATVVLNPNPSPYPMSVSGSGRFCQGEAGVDLQLDNSDNSIRYQLFYNGVASSYGTALGATGTPIDFGFQLGTTFNQPGVYTVFAFNTITSCSAFMPGSITIVMNDTPGAQNVIGGGSYCAGSSAGAPIRLDNSVPGISYQLYNSSNTAIGSPLMGTNAELNFGPLTAIDPAYYVVATNPATGCHGLMLGTKGVDVTLLPIVYSVIGGGVMCAGGTPLDISLTTSEFGKNYQLMMGLSRIGLPQAGNGTTLSLGSYSTPGNYTVVATDAFYGCTANMGSYATIHVNPLPAPENLTTGGSYCSGGAGLPVGLTSSELDVDYELFHNLVSTGSIMHGTGSAFNFGTFTVAGDYTVKATNAITSCSSNMTGTSSIFINPLPTVHNVTGGGAYCATGTGVSIGLDFSDLGVNYQLMNGSTMVGTSRSGLNSELNFGAQTNIGTYTINATNASTGCTSTMTGTAPVTINPLPLAYPVTGGGSFCAGSSAPSVNVTNTAIGIDYKLWNGLTLVSTMSGTGTGLTFGPQSTPGVYTITASNPATSCVKNMTGSATISVNPLPSTFVMSGGGNYCSGGTGVHIGLSGTNTGVSYQLSNGTTTVGTSILGTGSAIDFGSFTGSGVYTVHANNMTTGCNSNMAGSASVTINPLPTAYPVTGGGNYCQGAGGVHIGIANSETGVNYTLYNGTSMVGTQSGLAGLPVDFGTQTAEGSYWVASSNSLTGCNNNMAGNANIHINPLPGIYTVTGGGVYCEGSTGVHVGLSGSVGGFSYQLMNGSSPVGTAVLGNGSAIDFGVQSTTGMYSVKATNVTTTCSANMSANASVTVNPKPAVYTVTGGGSYCAGGTGVAVGLIGSSYGINYQLYNGTSLIDLPIGGTGAPLNFGLHTSAGTYTIKATNVLTGCTNTMGSSATINITPTVVPSVTISATPGNTVCQGSAATFSATSVNGGSSPAIEWLVGTTHMGTGATFSYIPSDNDIVTAKMTSNATCPSIPVVNNSTTMTVLNYVLPSASITSSTPNMICANTNVTYTASTTNAGSAPTYAWFKNNVNVGTGLSYTCQPVGGDIINFMMVSNKMCRSMDTAFSNDFVMGIIPVFVPIYSITAHQGPRIGVGISDTLRAVVSNAGLNELSYAWNINGYNIPGANQAKYVADTLFNNDTITCTVSGMGQCGGSSVSHGVRIHLENLAVTSANYGTEIKVLPNPNNGKFNIVGSIGSTFDEEVTIEITNMAGQVVYSNHTMAVSGNVNEQVQLSNSLANGNYLLNLRSTSGNSVYRLVIEQ